MVKPVSQHIKDAHGGSRAAFARACDVLPQQVTKWINGGFKVTAEGYVIGDTVKQDKTVKGCRKMEDAKKLWSDLGEIAVGDDGGLMQPFLHFPVGSDLMEVWHWFEDHFDLSVAADLMGQSANKIKP